MSDVTRRRFCVITGAGLVAAACGDNGNGNGSDGGVDMNVARDMAMPLDLEQPSNCKANGRIDAGPAAAFAVGDAKLFNCQFPAFVLRDMIGIYAVSAICTHQGCSVDYVAARSDFECPCHQSTFDRNGNVTMGPATMPLTHYPCTLDGNGHVIVDVNGTANPSDRLVIQD